MVDGLKDFFFWGGGSEDISKGHLTESENSNF